MYYCSRSITVLLIYIIDSTGNILANSQQDADDTFLFSVVQDITISSGGLNNSLNEMEGWPYS